MFDSSFKRSELYFSVLQILRIFSEWILGSMADLKSLEEEYSKTLGEIGEPDESTGPRQRRFAAKKLIRVNWTRVVSLQENLGKNLLHRIDRKIEDVKSLQDGV